jgi:hypothetical protein
MTSEAKIADKVADTDKDDNTRLYIGILHEDRDKLFFTDEKMNYIVSFRDNFDREITSVNYDDTPGAQIYAIINEIIYLFESQGGARLQDLEAAEAIKAAAESKTEEERKREDLFLVTQYVITRPTVNQDTLIIRKADPPQDLRAYTCSICLDFFATKSKKYKKKEKLNCEHKVHRYCSDVWKQMCRDMNVRAVCPACRADNYPDEKFIRYYCSLKK